MQHLTSLFVVLKLRNEELRHFRVLPSWLGKRTEEDEFGDMETIRPPAGKTRNADENITMAVFWSVLLSSLV